MDSSHSDYEKEYELPTPPTGDDPEKSTPSPTRSQISVTNEPRVDSPTKLAWTLTCVGLYLSALLYGKLQHI
jgi:hypothetical protein